MAKSNRAGPYSPILPKAPPSPAVSPAPHDPTVTHNLAPAMPGMPPLEALRRSVLSCLLWEDTFYESGQTIAERIAGLAADPSILPTELAALVGEAKHRHRLRHAPMWLTIAMLKRPDCRPLMAEVIERVIARADEPAELIQLYLLANRRAQGQARNDKGRVAARLPKALKLGIARALPKFDAYQLAKWKGGLDKPIRLRNVLKLVHPKPANPAEALLWQQAAADRLPRPDTWEASLAGGADKRATFTRLLETGKLGYLALLKNLHGMDAAGVDRVLVRKAIIERRGAWGVLPYQFLTAALAAPWFEDELWNAMASVVGGYGQLPGRTAVLVDISGSMSTSRVANGSITAAGFAGTLAALVPMMAEAVEFWAFDTELKRPPAELRAEGGVKLARWYNDNAHGGTALGGAIRALSRKGGYDRLIVITDEQTTDRVETGPGCELGYLINPVPYDRASYKVGHGMGWTTVIGFSAAVLRYIAEVEGVRPVRPLVPRHELPSDPAELDDTLMGGPSATLM